MDCLNIFDFVPLSPNNLLQKIFVFPFFEPMADVFSQLYIHVVFAVKNREALIDPKWEDELYKYITGVIQNRGSKMLAIGGMPDHIHIFIGLKPSEVLSDLVRETKKASHAFIEAKGFSLFPFKWQVGYGAFSYSRSQRDRVCQYIFNQKDHHRKRTFEEEFRKMLEDFEIEMGQKPLFDFFHSDDS